MIGLHDMPATKHDWIEDFPHENGNYSNECSVCGMIFRGHKRRTICKDCWCLSAKSAFHELEAANAKIQKLEKSQERATQYNHEITERCTRYGHQIQELEEAFDGLNEMYNRNSKLAAERYDKIKELESQNDLETFRQLKDTIDAMSKDMDSLLKVSDGLKETLKHRKEEKEQLEYKVGHHADKMEKFNTLYRHEIKKRKELEAVVEVLIEELVGFETCPYVSRNICIKKLNDDAAMNCEDAGNECLLMYYKQKAAKG